MGQKKAVAVILALVAGSTAEIGMVTISSVVVTGVVGVTEYSSSLDQQQNLKVSYRNKLTITLFRQETHTKHSQLK